MSPKEMIHDDVTTPEPVREGRRFIPQTDIFEGDSTLTLFMDMPGVDPKDITVHLEKSVLQIHGKVTRRQTEDVTYALKEYETGDFYRTFEVGDGIDVTGIAAEHRDGVLVLHLPKTARLRPKRIEVRKK
jgi:HSP20 family molecular chaperone IbpA